MAQQKTETKWPEPIQLVLDACKPLQHPRGGRLPLYLWPAMDPGELTDAQAEELVRELDRRGVGLVCAWKPGKVEESLKSALPVARAQTKLGLPVNANANACLYSFFNGDERTAHIDDQGKPFWDTSFGGKKDMGCPFALEHRREEIRNRIITFAEAYRRAGVSLDFVWADWEIDGPLEWNGAWESSKHCTRCREQIGDIGNFLLFQKKLRDLRAALQRDCYATPILERFPKALVGNYAVYPSNGFREWFDYFEDRDVEGYPAIPDQRARYRHWADEFTGTGYTFAMPVVYTWSWLYRWYDFPDADYHWFYNMLLVASNAAKHTPPTTPIISFVHWHTTDMPDPPDPGIRQMSEKAYQELLWHMLLRGVDTFFLWCPPKEYAKEVELLHPVWAAAQEYGEFLERGTPVTFDVPKQQGTVVSGLRLGDRVLVRRTDFGSSTAPVQVTVGNRTISVPAKSGACQVIRL